MDTFKSQEAINVFTNIKNQQSFFKCNGGVLRGLFAPYKLPLQEHKKVKMIDR